MGNIVKLGAELLDLCIQSSKVPGKFSLYPDALLLVLVASSWHDSPSKTLIAAATRNRI